MDNDEKIMLKEIVENNEKIWKLINIQRNQLVKCNLKLFNIHQEPDEWYMRPTIKEDGIIPYLKLSAIQILSLLEEHTQPLIDTLMHETKIN